MAELMSTDDVIETTASAAWNPGQMVQVADGRVGIVTGCSPIASGQKAGVRVKGIVKIIGGATVAAGAVGAVHIANQTVIATGGAGVDAGIMVTGVTSGTYGLLDLNQGI